MKPKRSEAKPKRYPSDLTRSQWKRLKRLLPPAKPGGGLFELVVRPEGQTKFEVLPWRWIVERTFAWLGRYRRLSKDYEGSEESSESWIYVAMIHLMLRRLDSA